MVRDLDNGAQADVMTMGKGVTGGYFPLSIAAGRIWGAALRGGGVWARDDVGCGVRGRVGCGAII